MSRIRSIHPGLWTDEAFVSLSPFARLLFMGIWNECDDAGSFEWSPLKLKMRILPADGVDAAALLAELVESEAVIQYETSGKRYGAVRNFCQYQRPKKPNSLYPQTEEVRAWVNAKARSTRDGGEAVENELPTDGETIRQRKEGGDKKEEILPPRPPRKRRGEGKHLIPDDWVLPPVAELTPSAKACAEQWTQASYDAVGEGFRLYWRTERKMKTDWRETWCNWVLREHSKVMRDQKFGNDPKPANGQGKRAFETPAEWNAYCDEMAAMYRGPGNGFEARGDRERREAQALEWEGRRKPIDDPPPRRTAATGPPRSIAELIPQQLAQASH